MEQDEVMICFYYMGMDDVTGEPRRITQFMTKNFSEWLKMFTYAQKHETVFWPREDDEKISQDVIKAISGVGTYIDDVSVSFGSSAVIQSIDVYLR